MSYCRNGRSEFGYSRLGFHVSATRFSVKLEREREREEKEFEVMLITELSIRSSLLIIFTGVTTISTGIDLAMQKKYQEKRKGRIFAY